MEPEELKTWVEKNYPQLTVISDEDLDGNFQQVVTNAVEVTLDYELQTLAFVPTVNQSPAAYISTKRVVLTKKEKKEVGEMIAASEL